MDVIVKRGKKNHSEKFHLNGAYWQNTSNALAPMNAPKLGEFS